MNAAEFISAFNARYYAAVGISAAQWTIEEIDEFFNKAQRVLIHLLIQQDQLELIANLIEVEEPDLDPAEQTDGVYEYDVDLSLIHFISGSIELEHEHNSDGRYPLHQIPVSAIDDFLPSPVNKTLFRTPKIAISGAGEENGDQQLTIIIDSYTEELRNVRIKFAAHPEPFDLDDGNITNLNESLHSQLVDIAVESAKEANTKILNQRSDE